MNHEAIFLLVGLFFLPLVVAQENTTNVTIQTYNLTVDNVTYAVNVTGNVTHIVGTVVNITWLPRFDVDIGFLRCIFKPFEQPGLVESMYKMECDFLYNISEEQIYVPIPMTMLKDIERIKGNERELGEIKGWYLFFQLLSVILLVALVSYVIYQEYWMYKY